MTYMGGGALVNALEKINKAMEEAGSRTCAGLKAAGKPLRYEGIKKIKGSGQLDPKTGQGDTYESHVHNIQMAEVEVNTETGEVKVIKMTSATISADYQSPGCEGQLEGGMDQGIGFALREIYIPGETKDWITFKFPTIENMPEMELIFRETPRANGTLGATGIGEMTMVSTAPAVTNAIYNACRVRIFDLPATPDEVKKSLEALSRYRLFKASTAPRFLPGNRKFRVQVYLILLQTQPHRSGRYHIRPSRDASICIPHCESLPPCPGIRGLIVAQEDDQVELSFAMG
jgi:aldehyde oxidoreductase